RQLFSLTPWGGEDCGNQRSGGVGKQQMLRVLNQPAFEPSNGANRLRPSPFDGSNAGFWVYPHNRANALLAT
ncbi:hypothetical protein ACRQ4K_13240, partial [Corynebacterium striatum]|uniref:hypothetical protein n=1 Tax=Corynebacterium striatum TaxID=43770 RepID=UPI003D79B5EF